MFGGFHRVNGCFFKWDALKKRGDCSPRISLLPMVRQKLNDFYILIMKDYTFYVYILTNPAQSTLYIGVTNDLSVRLNQHKEGQKKGTSFTGKYFCYHLIYFETYKYISKAIAREKQLKKWSRAKKEALIKTNNPNLNILNSQFYIPE